MIENLARLARRHLVLFVALRDPALDARRPGAPRRPHRASTARWSRATSCASARSCCGGCGASAPTARGGAGGGLEHAAHQPLPRHQAPGAGVKSVEFRREREATRGASSRPWSHACEARGPAHADARPSSAACRCSTARRCRRSAWRAPSRSTATWSSTWRAWPRARTSASTAPSAPPLEAAPALPGRRFPATVRALRRHLALSAALLVLGVGDRPRPDRRRIPTRFYALVGEDYAQGRTPAATTEELRAGPLRRQAPGRPAGRVRDVPLHAQRAGRHALRGARLRGGRAGHAAAVHQRAAPRRLRGALPGARARLEFWAWLLPHGVTELLAVVLCGAAGLAVGESAALPGPPHAPRATWACAAARPGVVVLGAVLMLLLAGLIEGIFRQTVHDVALRLLGGDAVGAVLDRLLHARGPATPT